MPKKIIRIYQHNDREVVSGDVPAPYVAHQMKKGKGGRKTATPVFFYYADAHGDTKLLRMQKLRTDLIGKDTVTLDMELHRFLAAEQNRIDFENVDLHREGLGEKPIPLMSEVMERYMDQKLTENKDELKNRHFDEGTMHEYEALKRSRQLPKDREILGAYRTYYRHAMGVLGHVNLKEFIDDDWAETYFKIRRDTQTVSASSLQKEQGFLKACVNAALVATKGGWALWTGLNPNAIKWHRFNSSTILKKGARPFAMEPEDFTAMVAYVFDVWRLRDERSPAALFALTMLYSMQRPEAVFRSTWKQINFIDKQWDFLHAAKRETHKNVNRELELTDTMLAILKEEYDYQKKAGLLSKGVFGGKITDSNIYSSLTLGKPKTGRFEKLFIGSPFHKVYDRKIKEKRILLPYDLRKAAVSFRSAGYRLEDVAKTVGHSVEIMNSNYRDTAQTTQHNMMDAIFKDGEFTNA